MNGHYRIDVIINNGLQYIDVSSLFILTRHLNLLINHYNPIVNFILQWKQTAQIAEKK
jgi:hypothetical protein